MEGLAEIFVDHASALEQVERTIAALEVRRATALREFHAYQKATKRQPRFVSDDVIEADYVAVPRKAA